MNKTVRSIVFMFLISFAFTSLVSIVKIVNDDRIRINQEIKLQRTILKVLGIDKIDTLSPEKINQIFNDRIEKVKSDGRTLYICRDKEGEKITGYAFPVEGPGFWGPIYAMAAANPELTKLIGVSFYSHSETPGLGGRISESWFSDQFKGLSLELSDKEKQYFFLTPEGDGKAEKDLDAITGASRTSDAVELFLNRELKVVVDEIKNERFK